MLVTTSASTSAPLFAANYAAVSIDPIDIGNSTEHHWRAGLQWHHHASQQREVCGAATPGVGKTPHTEEQRVGLPRISDERGNGAVQPAARGPEGSADRQRQRPHLCGRARFGSVHRQRHLECHDPLLTLSNNATLTLTGDVYSFCSVSLRNYVEAPGREPHQASCGSTSTRPRSCGNAATARAPSPCPEHRHHQPEHRPDDTLQLFVAGSPTVDLGRLRNSSSAQTMMAIYAPQLDGQHQQSRRPGRRGRGQEVPDANNSSITYDSRVSGITTTDWATHLPEPAVAGMHQRPPPAGARTPGC